jgi:serine phosphatase RsbU (regulator of sigma subunit)
MLPSADKSDYLESQPSGQLDALARQRMSVLCIVYMVLGLFALIVFAIGDMPDLFEAAESNTREDAMNLWRGWGRLGGYAAAILVAAYFLWIHRSRMKTRDDVVSAATMMVVLSGVLILASRLVYLRVDNFSAAWGVIDVFTMHIVACMLLPWDPKESAKPFALLLLVWMMSFIVPNSTDWEITTRLVASIASWAGLLPGMGLAWFRGQRREEVAEREMLGEQMRTMGGELSKARIVHDAMFPEEFDTGHVRFEYDYRPIAEIGGDYVHVHNCADSGRIYLTLLDVAGHGLAAALTVNRLFGELERIRAEDPDAMPGTVMDLLNRYINLTMATHSMYATGACIMLDPSNGEVAWVNAGHPPAIVRKSDGSIRDLGGTTMLLGALAPEEFETNQKSTNLEPGDVLIAYTDGAFEARDLNGERFGLDRLRETTKFNPPPRDWSRFIANAVDEHHCGNTEDDVLVASLHLRSLRIGALRDEQRSSAAVGQDG